MDTRTEDRDLAAVALAALLEHPDTWSQVDERLLEALMAYALNSVDGFSERLGLPADAPFDLGNRGSETDVMGRVDGEPVGAIEIKVHSNLNWPTKTEAYQLDDYAAPFHDGAPLLLLTSERRVARLPAAARADTDTGAKNVATGIDYLRMVEERHKTQMTGAPISFDKATTDESTDADAETGAIEREAA